MNSEMYVTGNDCYGSGARAIFSLTLSLPLSLAPTTTPAPSFSVTFSGDVLMEGSSTLTKRSLLWTAMTADDNNVSHPFLKVFSAWAFYFPLPKGREKDK